MKYLKNPELLATLEKSFRITVSFTFAEIKEVVLDDQIFLKMRSVEKPHLFSDIFRVDLRMSSKQLDRVLELLGMSSSSFLERHLKQSGDNNLPSGYFYGILNFLKRWDREYPGEVLKLASSSCSPENLIRDPQILNLFDSNCKRLIRAFLTKKKELKPTDFNFFESDQ